MTKKEVVEDMTELSNRIDGCISGLIASRLNKDDVAEADAIFEMENLMVDCQQELSFIIENIDKIQC